jgi:DNA-binding MarR family transcriptional regulator
MKLEDEIRQSHFENEWQKLSINLSFTYNWSKERLHSFFKEFGITMQQFNVLRILRGQFPKPVSSGDIRDRLIDKMSDTPRIIDRLCKEELVSKTVSETDKRFIDVLITPKGLDLLKLIDQNFDQMTDFYKNLTEEEARIVNMLFDKLRG